jgi:hypothetical protein
MACAEFVTNLYRRVVYDSAHLQPLLLGCIPPNFRGEPGKFDAKVSCLEWKYLFAVFGGAVTLEVSSRFARPWPKGSGNTRNPLGNGEKDSRISSKSPSSLIPQLVIKQRVAKIQLPRECSARKPRRDLVTLKKVMVDSQGTPK